MINQTQLPPLTSISLPVADKGTKHAKTLLASIGIGKSLTVMNPPPHFSEVSVSSTAFNDLLSTASLPSLKDTDLAPIALSDFDGTLTSGESGSKIFEYGVLEGFYLPTVRPELDGMLDFFSLAKSATSSVGEDFLRVLKAFRSWSETQNIPKEVKEEGTQRVYKMLSWIYAGHTEEEVKQFAERAFQSIGYEDMHYQGAQELVQILKDKGISTLLVSVKFEPILAVAARFFGIPSDAVAGMNLEIDKNGRYTTVIKPPVTFREGKIEASKSLLRKFSLHHEQESRPLFAMGDSPSKSDEQLLSMAEIAIVVEPQTPYDAEYARVSISKGRKSLILDYEKTRGGLNVELFDRTREIQIRPTHKFL